MSLQDSVRQGSSSFKPEFSLRSIGYRTPSPPLAYHEPISPQQPPTFSSGRSSTSTWKRRKLQDASSPALSQLADAPDSGRGRDFRQLEYPRPSPLAASAYPSHTSPSPLDVFAAVATSPTLDKPSTSYRTSELHNDLSAARGYSQEQGSLRPPKQRGSKRTRSEIIDVRSVFAPDGRPASSYVPQNAWGIEHDAPTQATVATASDLHDLQSDAELLLGFSLGSRAESARHSAYPPPTVDPSHSIDATPRNHFARHATTLKMEQPVGSSMANGYTVPQRPYEQVVSEQWPRSAEHSSVSHYQYENSGVAAGFSSAQQHSQTAPAESSVPAPTDIPETKPRVYRGWPKGKPRGPRNANGESKKAKKAANPKKAPATGRTSNKKQKGQGTSQAEQLASLMVESKTEARRHSFSGSLPRSEVSDEDSSRFRRWSSVPADIAMRVHRKGGSKHNARSSSPGANVCAHCNNTAPSNSATELWIGCNGCDQWYHANCVGFESERKVKEVDKFFCAKCEQQHGPTTYVRKSSRAHANVDYAGLHEGKIRTAADEFEHHYIQPIKDGKIEFLPETFARLPPELVTADFFERSSMDEPVVIPAYLNPRPLQHSPTDASADEQPDPTDSAFSSSPAVDGLVDAALDYDCVPDHGQDLLDMVIPEGLTVRRAAELYGPEEKVEVIDVKLQEGEDRRWNMRQWADYYEDVGEKPVRNVISLEVSQSRLGRLIQRPRVVRDLDLQDAVWPREESAKGIYPKVQFYCLMSVADCYTDFHIDFGGSSVYYHIIKGRKTFFFIPPKPENLKKYEKWCNAPDQNNVFLGNETKECYRVDLYPGDTMLIPSGWIHAVWTPENSLVIGGNFLTRMHYGMQIQINEIEKNTGVSRKFRYPYFQRIQWYSVVQYLEQDPIPLAVAEALCRGEQFTRKRPVFMTFDGRGEIESNNNEEEEEGEECDESPELFNARYYSRGELDGLPDLLRYIFRTTLISLGKVSGVTKTTQDAVIRSLPKGYGEPVEMLKTFAMWVAWKRGNEEIPPWAHPGADLPESDAPVGAEKKKNATAVKRSERQAARGQSTAAAAVAPTSVDRGPWQAHPNASAEQTGSGEQHLGDVISSAQTGNEANSPNGNSPERPLEQRFGVYTSTRSPKIRAEITAEPATESSMPLAELATSNPPEPVEAKLNGAEEVKSEVVKSDALMPDAIMTEVQKESSPEQTPLVLADEPSAMDSAKAAPQIQHLLPAPSPSAESRGEVMSPTKPMRSKACPQCRLSKRRCVHDENGRIDPVKAQVPSVPRGPRKRWSGPDFDASLSGGHIKAEDGGANGLGGDVPANPYWIAGDDGMGGSGEAELGDHARSMGLLPTDSTLADPHNLEGNASSIYPEEPVGWLAQSSPYPMTVSAANSNIDPALSSIDPLLQDSTVTTTVPVASAAPRTRETTTAQAFDPSKSRTPSVRVQGTNGTESAATSDSRPSSPLTDVDPAPMQPTPTSRKRKQSHNEGTPGERLSKRQASAAATAAATLASPRTPSTTLNGTRSRNGSSSKRMSRGLADGAIDVVKQMKKQGQRGASIVVDDAEEDESTRLVRELAGAEFGLRRRSSKGS